MLRVPLLLLGFGKMGGAAFRSFLSVGESLRGDGIAVDLLGILEADQKVLEEQRVPHVTGNAKLVVSSASGGVPLRETLYTALGLQAPDRFVVFDATPSHCHHSNLIEICEGFPHALYLGEKPLFTSREQLCSLDRFGQRVCCDFVENLSLPMIGIGKMIREGFSIRTLRFWRLNSSGVLKVLLPEERVGVTGGALLDKAIHDLSATSMLLENSAGAFVEDAVILSFMPFSGNPIYVNRFLSSLGTTHKEIGLHADGSWTADAAGFAKTRWLTDSHCARAEYAYSWIGIDQFEQLAIRSGYPSLRGEMRNFDFDESSWLYREHKDAGLFTSFEQQEVRLAIIEGQMDGIPVQLVANFLDRPGIAPFLFETRTKTFINLDGPRYGANSLCRILDQTIRSYALSEPELNCSISGRVINQAHRAAFDIRDYAFSRGFSGPAFEWNRSIETIGTQLKTRYRSSLRQELLTGSRDASPASKFVAVGLTSE
ncbi:MAG: hypothetical protein LAO30_22220 [Acidobacteriia bacterium]|nr:hypothetical protein [Terriglobia bacterium]